MGPDRYVKKPFSNFERKHDNLCTTLPNRVGVACAMRAGPLKHLDELDSLRGLAALSVVLLHIKLNWFAYAPPVLTAQGGSALEVALKPFTAGREAVILFFVLSGLVLAMPAVEGRAQSYAVFVTRRVVRIYIPYFAAIALAAAAYTVFARVLMPGAEAGSTKVDWPLLGQHAIFLGQFDTDLYDMPIWSLVYEMRISLVFPLLCAVTLRMKPVRSVAAAVGVYGAAIAARKMFPSMAAADAALDTLHYAVAFVVGINLARERERIASWMSGISTGAKLCFGLASMSLYFYGAMSWLELARRLTGHTIDSAADYVTTAGAAGLIVLCLNAQAWQRILLYPPVQALGKRSYSLYLLHYPICLYMAAGLAGRLPMAVIAAACLGTSLGATWVFYQLVEAPCVHWGRALTSRSARISASGESHAMPFRRRGVRRLLE